MPKTKSAMAARAARGRVARHEPAVGPASPEQIVRGQVSAEEFIAQEKERQRALQREYDDMQRVCKEMVQALMAARQEARDLQVHSAKVIPDVNDS
eukprot:CAMPEP_0197887074 /NCGR_PEP_ID=MMETSP1439-20131203/19014_1 /TAXON_ID=66791 /ORGANISM="Gonyaulax spinifera, Strain CCMP409" /LENGTH=95 /DNA_ID=CAMNT_0043506903 /DNA_START=73 /DNA_END=357 /DNA_ORIENTATION=-